MAKEEYGAKDLAVLEGLDAVRKRPGMYIGTTDSQGLMHCLWEIIDNSVDEALAGFCNRIIVTLHADGSISVDDNGRGIPVDKEPKTKLSGVEVVLTKLHAGAKFGNSSYNAVGGLHGVGSSVVNALSSRLDVEVDRDGKTYHMAFHQGHPGVYTDADPEHPSPDSPFKRTRKNRPTELDIIGKVPAKRTGTRIRYWADPEIFNKTAEFSYEQLVDRVRQTSFLVPGLKITVIDENIPETRESGDAASESETNGANDTVAQPVLGSADEAAAAGTAAASDTADAQSQPTTGEKADGEQSDEDLTLTGSDVIEDGAFGAQPDHPRVAEFLHTGGVKDFVDYLSKGEPVSDIWRIQGEGTYEEETQAVGANGELHAEKITRTCGVDIALRWVNGYDTVMRSFVNIIETPGGGMHVDGLMNSVTRQVRKAVEANARKLKVNLKDSNMKVERDDIMAGLVAVVTVRIAEPQFQGQTKDVLGTAQVKPIVTRMSDKQFGEMITGSKRGYKEQSGRVLEKIVGEMHARVQSRKAKEVTRRKNALESASMPAKLSDCQPGNDDVAELFIVEGDSALGTAKAARNAGFQALLPIRGKILNVQKASITQMLSNKECAAIIQVVGAGSGQSFDIEQSRYHKVIMMTDADVDGAHIRILLLTLFYRYMPELIYDGHVYIAMPPLYKVVPAKGEGEYLYDDKALELYRKKHKNEKFTLQRYKGLGEMDPQQLWETTLDPKTRRLRRIEIGNPGFSSDITEILMGTDVPPRKEFIYEHARDAELDV